MLTPQMLHSLQSGITVEKLKTIANQITGLYGWGNDDFTEPLQAVLDLVGKMYGGNRQMLAVIIDGIINILSTRLYINNNIRSNPRILDNRVHKPLFVTGLPRTGTTMMHRLFASDIRWRVLRYWELSFPYRRIDVPNFDRQALLMTEESIRQINKQHPEFEKRHEMKADSPEECFNILRLTFQSISWGNELFSSDYIDWYTDRDMTDSYRYYKKVLQVQLWRKTAPHLLLKCPSHLLNVDVILNVFEDGNIVWMHRNPCESIASGLSLLAAFVPVDSTPGRFFDSYMNYFEKSLKKAMTIDKSGNSRLRSVSYKKAKETPIPVIEELYKYWDYPWESEVEDRIRRWKTENPQHKHGVHKYSLEQFGLTKERIHERFAFYYDNYGDFL